MSFLTPLAALGALVAIPIILLYILRLRRRETMVSSNFLWQQILRDTEANTPLATLTPEYFASPSAGCVSITGLCIDASGADCPDDYRQ